MLILYRILTIIIFFFTPLILIYRLIKKKENFIRFKEKFCFSSKIRAKGKLIWFHGASVGELQSIIPLLEIYNKEKKIKQILVTSNTLSSSKIIQKLKLKKVIHQFYPLDINFFTKKFLNYWSPSVSFFIDSEIWPNMIFNLKRKQIPIILLNGRITKKSFRRWSLFSEFAKKVFGKFDLCFSSNKETRKYLISLGANNIKYIGNLKYAESEKKNYQINSHLKKFMKNKKVWCASSTHFDEEKLCGYIHKKLKIKYKNLLTIIIPRHINRIEDIKKDLAKLKLNVHLDEPNLKIKNNTDIYLVNAYGKTKAFYSNCKNVFLGGSIVNRGGQNPLEAARYGCQILHGENVSNFHEIYKFLSENKVSISTKTLSNFTNKLDMLLSNKKSMSKNIKKKINNIGSEILKNTQKEISLFLKK